MCFFIFVFSFLFPLVLAGGRGTSPVMMLRQRHGHTARPSTTLFSAPFCSMAPKQDTQKGLTGINSYKSNGIPTLNIVNVRYMTLVHK